MITKLDQSVYGINNEITTINELDKKGLIKYEKCIMTGKKINGERKEVLHYQAVLIPSIKDNSCECWDISKFAYLSKTNQKSKILESVQK